MNNVIFADFGKDLDLRSEVIEAILFSRHPAACECSEWIIKTVLPAINPFGFPRPPGAKSGVYRWPGSRSEFNAI